MNLIRNLIILMVGRGACMTHSFDKISVSDACDYVSC
jgi:hypothetical protein